MLNGTKSESLQKNNIMTKILELDGPNEETSEFSINKEFAAKYEQKKRREEISQRKQSLCLTVVDVTFCSRAKVRQRGSR